MATETKTKYVGIADCHGIEYFLPATSNAAILQHLPLRAASNRHRHALYFEVDLDEDQSEQVVRQMQDRNFEEALRVLKSFPELDVELQGGGNLIGSWELIPNKSLDPWS